MCHMDSTAYIHGSFFFLSSKFEMEKKEGALKDHHLPARSRFMSLRFSRHFPLSQHTHNIYNVSGTPVFIYLESHTRKPHCQYLTEWFLLVCLPNESLCIARRGSIVVSTCLTIWKQVRTRRTKESPNFNFSWKWWRRSQMSQSWIKVGLR